MRTQRIGKPGGSVSRSRTMAKIVMILAICALFLAIPATSTDEVQIKPAVRKLMLKDGAKQDLECSVNTTDKSAKLQWTTPVKDIDRLEKTGITGETISWHSTIKIDSFDPKKHAGSYTCTLMKTQPEQANIELIPVTENKTEPTFDYNDGDVKPATLSCNINADSESMEWLRGDEPVTDSKNADRYEEIKENNTLIIKKATRDDAGVYIARFHIKGMDNPYNCEVRYLASPMVLPFDQSKNYIQEDNMELQCKVKGYPPAVVTWYKNGQPLNFSTGEKARIQQSPLNGYENAHLVIKRVEFEDAGTYLCEAYSAYFNESSSKEIIVRVKDKLAALWPFLGIVGEVVVLCTIIFIYEKRRNKQAEQEENAAQETDGASTDKKEGLRHRNTNNPTA